MIEVYLANFKTSGKANRKSNKPNKPDRDRSKKIKLPGLLQVTKRDPKDLLAEVKNLYDISFKFNIFYSKKKVG